MCSNQWLAAFLENMIVQDGKRLERERERERRRGGVAKRGVSKVGGRARIRERERERGNEEGHGKQDARTEPEGSQGARRKSRLCRRR